MLRSTREIIGYKLVSRNGDAGKCKDLLFDDRWWTVRHMVADTGAWFVGKQLLIPPILIDRPDWRSRTIFLDISRKQLEDLPAPEADEPVSREKEEEIFRFFGHPGYWYGDDLWGLTAHPTPMPPAAPPVEPEDEEPVNIEYEARLYDFYGRPFEKNIDKKLQQAIANPFI